MRDDDDEDADVDFVIGGTAERPPEEELAHDPRREWPSLHRHRRVGWVLLAAGVAVAVVVQLTSTRPPGRSRIVEALPTFAAEPPLPSDPTLCGPRLLCTPVRDAPPAALSAVSAHIAHARTDSVLSVLANDGSHSTTLWFRRIHAGVNDLDIVVRVTQPRGTDRLVSVQREAGRGRVRSSLMARSSGFTILVQVDSADFDRPSPTALRALAVDRRLLLVS